MIALTLRQRDRIIERFRIFRGSVSIGRATENDIVLRQNVVSHEHAVIEERDGEFLISDRSRFGTSVNRCALGDKPLVLQPGDMIHIRPFTIEVVELEVERGRSAKSFRAQRRWDTPFDRRMDEADVDRVLARAPFDQIDSAARPELRKILQYDARIRRFTGTSVIMREGDYGDTVYFVLSGKLRVFKGLPSAALGHHEPQKKGILASLAQLIARPLMPESRDLDGYIAPGLFQTTMSSKTTDSDDHEQHEATVDIDPAVLDKHDAMHVGAGNFTGEISALSRTPRTATVIPDGPVELLEIRWQGFRDIRMYHTSIRNNTDQQYRDSSLKIHLLQTPLFSHLGKLELAEIAKSTVVERYGTFDWFVDFANLQERRGPDRVDAEPLIAGEGDYPNGIIIIRSGFARVSKHVNNGHYTVRYAGTEDPYIFGLEEILAGWKSDKRPPLEFSLRAIGYADVLIIPTTLIEKFLSKDQVADYLDATFGKGRSSAQQDDHRSLDQGMQEFLCENHYVNGKESMVIDLDRCTRCDDCVRACAVTHDGNPRFIRHGNQFGKYMVANACMHCADPVCMIDCPTGAITRNAGGQVFINDATCVGCGNCASSCPYENIRMVEISDSKTGDSVISEDQGKPILKATKCDLCIDQLGGPACQNACPHDALKRLNLSDLQTLEGLH
jgi:Fe-S-cluster-containing dehydrogenase component/CRP-like cAMP-binding protein